MRAKTWLNCTGSLADEVLVAQLDFVRLSNTQHLDYVEAFESVYAYAGGGLDRAFLYGTAADDSFAAHPSRHAWSVATG